MFKNHPKGLLGAALSNMGERFGFYTMMAILVLFLQAKFGLDATWSGIIYSVFYALIYILALVGGIIADSTRKYKTTIFTGLLIMATGYLVLGFPTPTPVPNKMLFLILSCFALLLIAFGNGLFKGNLQAVVGQMYDQNPQYASNRDRGFMLFYMFINIGAFFAPLFAVAIRNGWLKSHGFGYEAKLPELCHKYIEGTINSEQTNMLLEYASKVSGSTVTMEQLSTFVHEYLGVFTTGFHYAFLLSMVAMLVSIAIFMANKHKFPVPPAKVKTETGKVQVDMDISEIRRRVFALLAIYGIVIFFWFSFHQNGLTLTLFAKDYTDLSAIKINFGLFAIQGAEVFQSFNPLFIVVLAPIVMAIFGWLNARNMEPSTPRKIAIGMFIASLAFVVMAIGSFNLPSLQEVDARGGLTDAERVTPWLLIISYFILTVAELFISPLGISFVSKVAPPHLQGLMQGGWLGATAIGNQLLFIGAILYKNVPLWVTWAVFVVVCLISMLILILMLRWLESITK